MMNSSAEAFAPATMANLGVGFDILGLALHEPGDIVRAQNFPQRRAALIDPRRNRHSARGKRFCECLARIRIGTHWKLLVAVIKR